MARYWGRNQATRELAFSIYHSRAKENIATKIEEIINPQTRARLETYSKELTKAQLELEDSYNNILLSIFNNDSILDDLANILSNSTYEQHEQNLLANFFKTNTSIINENFKQDIKTYVNNYNKMYDGMINAADEITHIMEKFRGDRQLYGIGTSSSLSIMSASAYSSLERNNRDLFSLKFKETPNGTYQKLDQLQVNDKYSIRDLKSRITNELYGGDVLTDILNSQFSVSGNTTFKQVWKELKNNQVYSSAAYGKSQQELNEMKNTTKYAWRSRKLEYLFDESILQNIGNINQLNYKISNSENTLGFATGDVNIKTAINGQEYSFAIQLKYAGGSRPWNGTSISSLQNSLKFLSNKDGIFSEFAEAINSGSTQQMKDFFQNKLNTSLGTFEEQVSRYAHNTIDDIFQNAFGGEPMFMGFLNSESYDNLEQDIFDDWMNESAEANEDTSDSYDDDWQSAIDN